MKYVIILAFGLVAGFFAEEEYFRAPGSPETVASLSPLDKIGGAISNAFAPPKPEATVPPNELAGAASVDEELDYMVARRLGSLDGWSAFLAAHANGAYAQSARAEVERLRLAERNRPRREGSGRSPTQRRRSASIDEELDYRRKRLGSLTGWRAFLATHGSGAYAQSARAEVENCFPQGRLPPRPLRRFPMARPRTRALARLGVRSVPRGTKSPPDTRLPRPAAAEVSE